MTNFEENYINSNFILDCTQAQSTCQDNEVNGYPTLQYFRDGEKVAVFRGSRYVSKRQSVGKIFSEWGPKVVNGHIGGTKNSMTDRVKIVDISTLRS